MDVRRAMDRCRLPVLACAMALLSLLLSSGPGFAQKVSGPAVVEVRLEIEKPGVVLGEPVYATVRLRNVGKMPVDVPTLLDPQTGVIHIEVSSSSRPRFVFLPLFYADTLRARTALAPGDEIAAAFPIFYGALGWTFDRSGDYRVSVEYRTPSAEQVRLVPASPVAVTVADVGEAGALLVTPGSASEEAGKFLLWQRGDQLHAGQALLTDLLRRYPDSPLADYARLAFGRNLSRSFRNYATGKVRPADCEPALNAFQKVRSDRLPALLQIQQRLDEARCYVTLSQPAQAQESIKKAEQVADDRPEFRLLFQQAIRLEPTLDTMITIAPAREKPAL